jgi:hypothetical protein
VDSYSSRPAITHRLKRPTRSQREQRHTGPYLVLLRVEFTLLRTIASRTVRSYRTLSPLPFLAEANKWRSPLCCTCRRFTPPRRYLVPCSLKPGLSSPYLRTRQLSGQLGADYSLSSATNQCISNGLFINRALNRIYTKHFSLNRVFAPQ